MRESFTTQTGELFEDTLYSGSKTLTVIGCCEMWVVNEQKLKIHFWSQQRFSLFGLAGYISKAANLIVKEKINRRR